MLSNIEYKLLVALFALLMVVGAVRTSEWGVDAYNRYVQDIHAEKERLANGTPKISFGHAYPGTIRPYEVITPLQIVLLPFAFCCALLRKAGPFLISSSTLLLVLYGYFDWMSTTREIVLLSEGYVSYENTSLRSYLLFNSTISDIGLLIGTAILLIVQLAVLARFVAERIHAK